MDVENSASGPTPEKLTPEKLVASAPSSSKLLRTVTPEIQKTLNSISRRSNSYVETKYKCTITSDRLGQLRKIMETATRDHKVFSIKGGWAVIRRELLKRNWLEKIEATVKHKYSSMDDVTSNLPAKQDWESPQSYVEKCEKTVVSRMLQNYDVDLYWSMRKEPSDMQHRTNSFKLINRFSRSLFASKEGLALLLQQSYWYIEPGVANINYPRVYVLGFPDHYNLFVDDFRMTACMGLMKWFVERYETGDKHDIQCPEGKVPYTALLFAIDRCNEYVSGQKHLDIDKEFTQIWDHEWEQFLSNYRIILHENGLFLDFAESMTTVYTNVMSALKEIQRFWPQYEIDGMKNIWILKPGNKCRGRGIQLVNDIAEVDKVIGLKMKYVVQKYIERPLTIHKTKFDIRQWFMVTCVQPLTIWMYRDSYLRFSSQLFTLNNYHESLHLTNYSIQCKYTNVEQRDKALPEDNMWDCHTFKAYLKQMGCMEKWSDVIFPGNLENNPNANVRKRYSAIMMYFLIIARYSMQQSIVCAMLASQDTMDRRPNTFEIYGADFMLAEDFKPWLIEINCSPDLSYSTSVTSRMCPQCMEDIIKVVVDRRRDPNADTGLFEMVYKQIFPRTPPYLGMNLSVRGRRLFRNRARVKTEKEKADKQKTLIRLRKQDFIKSEFLRDSEITRILPKITSPDNYKGPVIADFIEDLHNNVNGDKDSGVDFIPALKVETVKKKYEAKSERVAKSCSGEGRPKTNDFSHCSVNRKRSVKENIRKSSRCSSETRNHLGLYQELHLKNKIASDNWETQTASILRGTNILNRDANTAIDVNKNIFQSRSLNAFDLNNILRNLQK